MQFNFLIYDEVLFSFKILNMSEPEKHYCEKEYEDDTFSHEKIRKCKRFRNPDGSINVKNVIFIIIFGLVVSIPILTTAVYYIRKGQYEKGVGIGINTLIHGSQNATNIHKVQSQIQQKGKRSNSGNPYSRAMEWNFLGVIIFIIWIIGIMSYIIYYVLKNSPRSEEEKEEMKEEARENLKGWGFLKDPVIIVPLSIFIIASIIYSGLYFYLGVMRTKEYAMGTNNSIRIFEEKDSKIRITMMYVGMFSIPLVIFMMTYLIVKISPLLL